VTAATRPLVRAAAMVMGRAEYKRFAAVGVDGWYFRPGGWCDQQHRERAGRQDEASNR
jgi:hypothetical protein